MQITSQTLREMGACSNQTALFEKLFPNGSPKTKNAAVAAATRHAGKFDWNWAANNLLSAPLLAEYNEACAPPWTVYNEASASLWAEYNEALARLYSEYKEACELLWARDKEARLPLWAEYEKACASLWAKHDVALAPLWAAYNEARAQRFVCLLFKRVK